MNVLEMHMNFKLKFNKIDSQKNRNLKVPEIDLYLNEAVEIFINIVANPKIRKGLGFEVMQATIDDLYPLVKSDQNLTLSNNVGAYPQDYHTFLKAYANIIKSGCPLAKARMLFAQQDDRVEDFKMYQSSYEWREVAFRFEDTGLKALVEGTGISVNNIYLTYLKQHPYIYASVLFPGGTYTIPGTPPIVLAGQQDCILPKRTHGQIIDIAVMLASGDIQASDYQLRQNKLSVNQIL